MGRSHLPLAVFSLCVLLGAASAASVDDEYEAARDRFFADGDYQSFFESHRDAEAPDGFTLPFGICASGEDGFCKVTQATLALDLTFGYRGGYQAQRNIAYCLVSGCDGALQPNRSLGCGWRMVIVASGSFKVDDTDLANLRLCSSQLDQAAQTASRQQARRLFRTIYGRAMPSMD